jgi:hypothetical protein
MPLKQQDSDQHGQKQAIIRLDLPPQINTSKPSHPAHLIANPAAKTRRLLLKRS